MEPAAAAAGSIGIPPLNLSQGPSMATAQSDGSQTGTNSVHSGTGDFVFKGTGRQMPNPSFADVSPFLITLGLGGAAWLIAKRFL